MLVMPAEHIREKLHAVHVGEWVIVGRLAVVHPDLNDFFQFSQVCESEWAVVRVGHGRELR
jgi:hypothetical protein